MKIRLLINLPVGVQHGMRAGRVFEVVRETPDDAVRYWVIGDQCEEVGVFPREMEIAEDTKAQGEQ